MKFEKLTYVSAEIDVTRFVTEDIVTASTADSFDYVDNDAWDA